MNLWIRSQDKERILNVCNLEIYDCETGYFVIYTYIDTATQCKLGEYTSKERALEVINDIEEHIGFLNAEMGAGRFGELDFQTDIVYEMPKE